MKQSHEKLWAVSAHLGSLLFPFWALIVFFVQRERSRYVAHHAHQAMWFFFTAWIVGLIVSRVPFLGGVLAAALGAVVLVAAVVGAVNALGGHWWEYPVVGRIWRKALGTSA
jgi:uncharacterized membrane protein